MKKDLQLCIDFGCKKIWMYHYKTTGKGKNGRTYWRYLKNYISNVYYDVCYYNK